MDHLCIKVDINGVESVPELCSNQEEADTKLLLHAKHSLDENPQRLVVIRSPSGDTDINILFISLFQTNQENIWIDYNTGNNRKLLHLSNVVMDQPQKSALIGFHSLTGNDYCSSFLRRGKGTCWKILEKQDKFLNLFVRFGDSWLLDEDTLQTLEEYICLLYGRRSNEMNSVRYEKFKDQYEKKHIKFVTYQFFHHVTASVVYTSADQIT